MKNKLINHKNSIKKEALFRAGDLLIQEKKYEEAAAYYDTGLKRLPNDPDLLYSKGVVFHLDKNLLQAINYYIQALQVKPNFFEAFENLAEAQTELLMFNDAALSLQAAITLNPKKTVSHIRLANVLARLRRYDEAITAATQALMLEPHNAGALMMRSNAYRGLNQINKSIQDLKDAISHHPDKPKLVYNLSFDLLLNEQFIEGWSMYEARFQTDPFIEGAAIAPMVVPRWNGIDSLDGKTILVCSEQGLGDQIQFGRYTLMLKNAGAKVIWTVDPPLVSIMQSMDAHILVTSALQPASALPPHDLYIPLMSLPGIFKTELNSIPSSDRYISSDSKINAEWANRFAHKNRPQIGLVWSGSPLHVNDHNRSMRLIDLQQLFALDADLHVLQTEIQPQDESLLKYLSIQDWRANLTSLHETAGLIDQLDLVITVDTSVAHLSAALGKPTWLMLPFAPDFRWLLNRTDSPWYPSIRLFRQDKPGNWQYVITDIYQALTKQTP